MLPRQRDGKRSLLRSSAVHELRGREALEGEDVDEETYPLVEDDVDGDTGLVSDDTWREGGMEAGEAGGRAGEEEAVDGEGVVRMRINDPELDRMLGVKGDQGAVSDDTIFDLIEAETRGLEVRRDVCLRFGEEMMGPR